MSTADRRPPTLDEIEEYETSLWLSGQLDRLERLVREHGADEEMLEAIDYLRDENDRWVSSEIEELDRSGKLSVPRVGTASH